ncbi:TM1812 family CRISPR-associated protein [Methanospirillum lacunae]|nr:TM1812 family CRISPR-associated protein [Methanospirillum lacunae]
MRCISCINHERSDSSRFCRDDLCQVTDMVQEAIWTFWHPEEIILCIRDPRSAHLASECESRGITVRKLWLPEGTNEDELWQTFTLLVELAEEGEEILFDVTDGHRSLPFIISLAATWMKEVRGVKIIGVVYATQPDEHGFRHIVNLQPVLQVIDWMAGVRALLSHTDAEKISHLFTGLQGNIYKAGQEPEPPKRLTGWSHLLGTFTKAVRLSRPVDAMYAAWGISQDLPVIRDEIQRFAPALLSVVEELAEIGEMAAIPSPEELNNEYLFMQLRLIRYQIDHGLEMQAIALSREWLISVSMLVLEVDESWLDADSRHTVSRTLTGLALTLQGIPSETTPFTHILLEKTNWKEMVRTWERVSDLRNDLAHCGMNRRNESLRSLLQRTQSIPDELKEFAQHAGIPLNV